MISVSLILVFERTNSRTAQLEASVAVAVVENESYDQNMAQMELVSALSALLFYICSEAHTVYIPLFRTVVPWREK